jgi:peptidyl-prolyl cis-trans isomerase A (cyclophilin A)
MIRRTVTSLFATALILAAAAVGRAETPAATATAPAADKPLLNPAAATLTAPVVYRVKVETTSGDFVIEVHREWAPHGADRFFNLVKLGFFSDCAFFRVIKDFMAQVGFHGDAEVSQAWSRASIPDDPVKMTNTRGTVSFAMSSLPNSRTTQFFVNFADNSRLDRMKFAPFGKVVSGMEVVDSLYAGYGEGAPQGAGPTQGTIMKSGNTYLKASFPKLDYILSATVLAD